MAGCIFQGPNPIANPAIGGQVFLPWRKQTLVEVCAGQRLFVDVRAAAFDVTPFKTGGGGGSQTVNYGESAALNVLAPHPCFLGARSGYTFDGPYLSYEPCRVKPPGSANGGTAGMYDPNDSGVGTFFFDLQCKRPILLPYPGVVSILGQWPGRWDINFVMFVDDYADARPSPIDSEVVLTMNIAQGGPPEAPPISNRRVNLVPPGAHSYTYRDSQTGTAGGIAVISHDLEDVPVKSGGVAGPSGPIATTVPVQDLLGQAGGFYNRWGVGNAQALNVAGCTTTSQGILTWHLAFT